MAVIALSLMLPLVGAQSAAAAATVFGPTDDATVRESRPDRNYGLANTLEVDQNARKDALVRFDVTGAANRPVLSATLRLYVLDSSSTGGDVTHLVSSDWREPTVTWANAPVDGVAIGDLGPAAAGTWVELDVTGAVDGDGPVSFRISSSSADGADYRSKETPGTNGPQLVVELGEPSDPDDPPPPGPGPVLTIASDHDATLRQSQPDRGYGLRPDLEVDRSSRKDIVIGFEVTGIADQVIERVGLRLFVLDPSSDGGEVALVEPSTWEEQTITWNSSPPGGSTTLGSFGTVAAGSWVELDVTAAVSGDGPVTLRVTSSSSNGADYASRQDAQGRGPELVVQLAPEPPASDQPDFPIRAAFYYPWFPEVWTVNGAHVAYHPDLGYYSSDDAAVQQAHISAMTEAGLDAAISSWWGFPNARDTRFSQLLDQTVALDSPLKWAAYQEGEGRADPTPEEIAVELEHLEQLAQSSAYLRVDDRFVVFVYNAEATDSCHVPERWTQANALIGNRAYISLLIFPGFRDCPVQPDAWHNYAPAHPTDHRVGYSYMISPGFWRADEVEPRLERDLDRWRQNVRDMVASGEDWQFVVSFNEWGEGTAIEAAAEWNTSYLDVLAQELAPPP